jgi:di/tricarboxylate transporter
MRPGGYRFKDYPKVGIPLSLLAILVPAWWLSHSYG